MFGVTALLIWSLFYVGCISAITISTTFLKLSISSSTVPPSPVAAKEMEFPTYVGLVVRRASILASLVVKSRVDDTVYSGVLKG